MILAFITLLFGTLTLLAGLGVAGLVVSTRFAKAQSWRSSLVAYKLGLPGGLASDDVAAWLTHIAASTHAPRFALHQPPPIALEVTGTAAGIEHVLFVPQQMTGAVLAGLRAVLPGVRLEELPPSRVSERRSWTYGAEGRTTNSARPLAHDRAERASLGLLASLQPVVGPLEAVCVQWIFVGATTPRLVQAKPSKARDVQGLARLVSGGGESADADAIRAARLKHKDPLLQAVVRVGVAAADQPRALSLFGRVWGPLRGLNAPGAQIVRGSAPSSLVVERLAEMRLPLLQWPVVLNTRELAGLIGFPIGDVSLPGLPRPAARQLPPAVDMPAQGAVVAVSTYPGMTERPLALKVSDRLRHTWAIGPTGVGKSTLLCNLIGQDIDAGRGLVLLDPKGDLVADVLDRVPDARRDDILLIDPSQTDVPVGVNLLHTGHGEHARELAVDHLTSVMASLWRSSWGPRTSDVIRNALLTLTHTTAADGSRFTLVELPELLLNPSFRGYVTSQPTVPESVRSFWIAYEQMSEGERASVIGPSLNKLRNFTTRTALRLMLGQSRGVRLDEVFTERRIILVNLASGVLGAETTALVGSLVMAGLWQATLARVTVAHEKRHPVILYLDEFQNFLRLPVDLADMLAMARGYGVGLVMAHQYMDQLTDAVKTAVLGTARTQIAFQVEHDDARALASRFAPLGAADLSGLAAYEIAMRPCVNGSTLPPVTGRTLPLKPPITDGAALAAASRQRFGMSRAEVEAALRDRIAPPLRGDRPFGRTAGGAS